MWIIKDGKKEEYDPEEVKIAKTDWGTYIVTIADNIRKSSVVIYETEHDNQALGVAEYIGIGMTKDGVVIIEKNKNELSLKLEIDKRVD